jgi:hypothetical protein
MHFKHQKAIILLISILLLVFITPNSIVANCEKTNAFQAQYGVLSHTLYVSVTPSLYDYYGNMSHTVYSTNDYANFVTPQVVEPIAASIQNITRNLPYSNEQFADAVLTLVHQIPYAINGVEYPVETLVNNSGDCLGLSLLAASIMQAGGLDVVLILYTGINPSHMNVGVYLPYTPVYHTAGMAPTDLVYNNKTYWTAECTPAEDWKVGDQWGSLANAEPVIIPLNNTEQLTPGQVSSSLNTPLRPSSITIGLSQEQSSANMSQEQSSIGENPRALTISGSISPTYSGENVSIYLSSGSSSDYFTTVTDDAGGYMLTWNFTSTGTYYITASWSGASIYAGADSETLMVFVGPESLLQLWTPEYNYVYVQESLAAYIFNQANTAASELSSLQGVNDFLSIPLETGVSLSYDFTVIQAGTTISNVQTETITIPESAHPLIMPGFRRQIETVPVSVPTETETVPVNVPEGLEPLILPDDFNQTINDQFCFILQNSCGNYSLNVSALNDYEMSNITQGINAAFMNASENIKENTWYNVKESISGNGITANLYNTNGTLIETADAPYDAVTSNEAIMLIANNVDSVVILKDLTVQALNSTTQPAETNTKTNNESRLLLPYVSLSILLVVTFSVALVYVKKKRQMRQKNRSNVHPSAPNMTVNQVNPQESRS